MTTLIAYRPHHRVGRTAPVEESAGRVHSQDLIAWSMEGDGLWRGRIDLLDAGTITRTGTGYAVAAWDGLPDGDYPTLTEAQRSLEPAHRARLRDEAEAARRHGVQRAAATVAGVVAL